MLLEIRQHQVLFQAVFAEVVSRVTGREQSNRVKHPIEARQGACLNLQTNIFFRP